MSSTYGRYPLAPGQGTVTSVGADGPLASSGGDDPTISLTGIVPIANGGTGQATASTAINALLPSQTGQSGKFLSTNGTVASWQTGGGGGGSPGGLDTQVQFNNTGAFDGSADLSFDYTNSRLGVGNATPATRLHVTGGSSGATPLGNTVLTVENNTGCHLSILSTDADYSAVIFGSPSSNVFANFNAYYNVGSPYIATYVGGSEKMRVGSSIDLKEAITVTSSIMPTVDLATQLADSDKRLSAVYTQYVGVSNIGFFKDDATGLEFSGIFANTDSADIDWEASYDDLGAANPYSIKIHNYAAAQVPFAVQGADAQSVNLMNWLDNTGTLLLSVDSEGNVIPGADTNTDLGSNSLQWDRVHAATLTYNAPNDVLGIYTSSQTSGISSGVEIITGDSDSSNTGGILLQTGAAPLGTRGDVTLDGKEIKAASTLNMQGNTITNAVYWTHYQASYTDFAVASTAGTFVAGVIPTHAVIEQIIVKHSTAFTGGAISQVDCNARCNIASLGSDNNTSPLDVFTAPSNTNLSQDNFPYNISTYGSTTDVIIVLNSTGANLNQLTQGHVDVYIKISKYA